MNKKWNQQVVVKAKSQHWDPSFFLNWNRGAFDLTVKSDLGIWFITQGQFFLLCWRSKWNSLWGHSLRIGSRRIDQKLGQNYDVVDFFLYPVRCCSILFWCSHLCRASSAGGKDLTRGEAHGWWSLVWRTSVAVDEEFDLLLFFQQQTNNLNFSILVTLQFNTSRIS